jgi:hypothetical protein
LQTPHTSQGAAQRINLQKRESSMEQVHILEELRGLRNEIQNIREDLRHARGFIGGVVWIIGTMAAVLGFLGSAIKGSF